MVTLTLDRVGVAFGRRPVVRDVSAIRQPGALMSGLVLRTTPPRAPRHQLLRPRLGIDAEAFRGVGVLGAGNVQGQ